jgi:hypothetical protein
MAPLKPLANFKFKHIFSLVLVDPSSSSKFIVAKTSILLPPSLELQDGNSKSLFTTSAFNLGIIVSAKKPISLDYDPIVPKPKKPKRLNGNLIKCFKIFRLQNCLE